MEQTINLYISVIKKINLFYVMFVLKYLRKRNPIHMRTSTG